MNFEQWLKRPRALVTFFVGLAFLLVGISTNFFLRGLVVTLGFVAALEGLVSLTFNPRRSQGIWKAVMREAVKHQREYFKRLHIRQASCHS